MPDTVYLLYSVDLDTSCEATPHAVYADPEVAAFDAAQEQAADASRVFCVQALPLFVKEMPDA